MVDNETRIVIDDLVARVRLLESQVAQLMGGTTPAGGQAVDASGFAVSTAGVDPEVLAALQKGNKIKAIKIYREKTGTSLAGAKDTIDKLAAQLGLG